MVFVSTLFTAIFVSNLLFYKLDGMTFHNQTTKIGDVVKQGIKVAIVTLLAVLSIYPINHFLLSKVDLQFIVPLLAIVGVYGFNLLINFVLTKLKIEDKHSVKVDHYVLLNSVTYTSVIIAVLNSSLVVSIGYALGYSIGYLLMMLLILTIAPKISLPGIPKRFKGVPAMLIAVGLIAMTFMGLAGIL